MFSRKRTSMQGYIYLNPQVTDEVLIRKKIDFEASFEELKLSSVSLTAITLLFTVIGVFINKMYNGTGNFVFVLLLFFAASIYFLFSKKISVLVRVVRDIKTIDYELQKRNEKQSLQKSKMEQIAIKREERLREKYKI